MRKDDPRETYLNDLFPPTGGGPLDRELAARELAAVPRDPIAIAPYEARLLQFLIRLGEVRRVIEVGTLHGYSTLAMAWALPADGRIVTIEKDPARAAAARARFSTSAVGERIEVRTGDAEEVLAGVGGPFDLAFIDANKGAYARYLDWAEANVRAGGFIVGDNSFLWGAVYDESSRQVGAAQVNAMRAFNARLAEPTRYDSTLIPTTEGLTIARKRFGVPFSGYDASSR